MHLRHTEPFGLGLAKAGRTDISVKTEFKSRVTLGGILSEQNLELLMGQL